MAATATIEGAFGSGLWAAGFLLNNELTDFNGTPAYNPDPDNFNPGYLMRSMHLLPKRGDKPEWQHTQDYWVEKDTLPVADLEDGCLNYE